MENGRTRLGDVCRLDEGNADVKQGGLVQEHVIAQAQWNSLLESPDYVKVIGHIRGKDAPYDCPSEQGLSIKGPVVKHGTRAVFDNMLNSTVE